MTPDPGRDQIFRPGYWLREKEVLKDNVISFFYLKDEPGVKPQQAGVSL